MALGRDSSDPRIWTLLAGANSELKAFGAARTDYLRALSCDRWYTQAFQGLGQLAGSQRNWKEAVHWYALALKTVVVRDPTVAAQLRQLLKGAERNASAATGHG